MGQTIRQVVLYLELSANDLMYDVLIWLLTVEVIGLAAFPLAGYMFPHLFDGGASISKPLGLLVIGYASWILSVLGIVPSNRATVLVLLLALAALSATLAWGRREALRELWAKHRAAIIIGEAVFLAVFILWAVYRSYDPAIDHTEQPMDFMFLNASVRADLGTPEDPWLRGETVSYYYFGYWMMGTLAKLTDVATPVSFNLALALIPAMAAVGIFGLVFNMVHSEGNRLRPAAVSGVAAAVFLLGVANLEGTLEFGRANGMGSEGFYEWTGVQGLDGPAPALAQSWKPDEFWWWWRASRVIGQQEDGVATDYTIEEFPFFSFMLGDLHPHVMSIPFVLLFLVACWSYLRAPPEPWNSLALKRMLVLFGLALALGGLGFTNMWDLPVFMAVLFGVVVVKSYREHGPTLVELLRGGVAVAIVVSVMALALITPYLISFTSQVSGVSAVVTTSRPLHLFIVWGLFIVAVTPFILAEFWRTTVDRGWPAVVWPSLAAAFLPFVVWTFLQSGTSSDLAARLLHVLPLALLVSIALYTALWLAQNRERSLGRVFALGLAALGLLLLMGPELLHVNDSFGGASERMNTVFKLYYQAWIVFAAASGFAIYYWYSQRNELSGGLRRLTGVWAAVFVLLLTGAAYYPPAAAASKGNLFDGERTLDGLSHLAGPGGEYGAIVYLRANSSPDSAVLEAVGGDYTSFGRISGSTGVPTVLGWPGHEVQWRGSGDALAGREHDVRRIYETADTAEAENLLEKYAVDYVYVGPRERQVYGNDGMVKFALFMDRVYSDAGAEIYRARN